MNKQKQRGREFAFVGKITDSPKLLELEGAYRQSFQQKFETMCTLAWFDYQLKNGAGRVPDFLELLQLFESRKVKYVLIGGYAVGLYSEPRFTKDIDFLVSPSRANAKALLAALTDFGAPVDNLSLRDLSTPGLLYVFGISPLRVDILNHIEGVDTAQVIKRARKIDISGIGVSLISLDDLIALKTLAGRPQDRVDVRNLKLWSRKGGIPKK